MKNKINSVWDDFNKKVDKLCNIISNKYVVLWGYSLTGKFIEHILRRKGIKVSVIMDRNEYIRNIFYLEDPLNYLNLIDLDFPLGNKIIICTFNASDEINEIFSKYNYRENEDYVFAYKYFDLEKSIPLSYFNWLETKYSLDLNKGTLKVKGSDNSEYGPSCDYDIITWFEYLSLKNTDGVFDFGFGKGGVLLLLNYINSDVKIGGVEYDKNIFNIAKTNFYKLKIELQDMICDNAANVTNVLDNYNYFYIANSFVGNTFIQVIKNIQESYERHPRKIILIYMRPVRHEYVISNSHLLLSKQLPSHRHWRYINIYTME